MRYHHIPVRTGIINKSTASVDYDVEKSEPSCTVGEIANWCSYGKQDEDFSKLKVEVPLDPTSLLLLIYPKK